MLRFLKRRPRPSPPRDVGFEGDFTSWSEAKAVCSGYDEPVILDKTRAAIAAVRDGVAAYERDSVLFDRPERPYPLIACLLATALANRGCLSVLDFGGSLGSSYFQCRPLLKNVSCLRWAVVEQPHYVDVGRREFTSQELAFHDSPEEACRAERPNLLLVSGVLAYLPKPHESLDELLRLRIPSVVVDRTAFLQSDRDRLTMQIVPSEIYPASYPAWFLGEPRFLAAFRHHGYDTVEGWQGSDRYSLDGDECLFKGFFFVSGGTDRA